MFRVLPLFPDASGWVHLTSRTLLLGCRLRLFMEPRSTKEQKMAGVKLIVQYPRPKDIEKFEKVYQNEHVPMAVAKLAGKTKIVASRVMEAPHGSPALYRIPQIHFPSMQALEACAASEGGQQTLANAVSISSGGPPILLIAEEETFKFS